MVKKSFSVLSVIVVLIMILSGSMQAQVLRQTPRATKSVDGLLQGGKAKGDRSVRAGRNNRVNNNLLLRSRPVGKSGGLQSLPSPYRRPAAVSAPLMAAGDGTTIYGSLIFAASWDYYDEPVGIYSFKAAEAPGVTGVYVDELAMANAGGVYIDGKYHCINYIELWGAMSAEYNVFDTKTWAHEHKEMVELTCISSDMTFDPVTQTVYGCFYNDNFDGYVFGTLDFATMTRRAIAPLQINMIAVAANSKGEIYSIGKDGNLYSINKATGQTTLVGATGITPRYLQSATFDLKTDKLYWTASMDGENSGLYEVSTVTGAAELICKFADNEEFVGLYIPAPLAESGAPGAAEGLVVRFEGGQPHGTVSFTMPTVTFGGGALSGTLSYKILFNGVEKASGTAVSGAAVEQDITGVAPGQYDVLVIVQNEEGSGPAAKASVWVGNDAPAAVRNISLTKGADGLALSWEPPTETVHSGYLDTEALRYTVVRHPEGQVVADKQEATRFAEKPESAEPKMCWYEIIPYVESMKGVAAMSDKVMVGEAFGLPYLQTFDTPESFDLYTVTDVNNDRYTWGYGGSNKSAQFSSGFEAADDWLVTPPLKLEKGYIYKLHFDTWRGSDVYEERLEVAMGTETAPADMTTILLPPTAVAETTPTARETAITVGQTGVYHIGFHAVSGEETFFLYVDNIGVEKGASVKAPAQVGSLSVKPAPDGLLQADISFSAPEAAVDGTAIDKLDRIVIYRGKQEIKVFDTPAPGVALSYRDTGGLQGNNTYKVVAANGEGLGLEASATVFLGTDIPDVPTDVTLAEVDGKAVITWKAPGSGAGGGYIDPAALTYHVQRATDNTVVAKGIKELTFTDTPPADDTQVNMAYYVFAESSAGTGMGAVSNTVLMGKPYSLPFAESFKDAYQDNRPWTVTKNDFGKWSVYEYGMTPDADPQDSDGGMLSYDVMTPGEETFIYSPKISMEQAVAPVLEFYYYNAPGSDNVLTVEVSAGNAPFEVVRTYNFAGMQAEPEGWTKARIPLDKNIRQGHIQVGFRAVGGAAKQSLHIDNISVKNLLEQDLAVTAFDVPSAMEPGTERQLAVTVYNAGTQKAAGYTVNLLRNGEERAASEGRELAPGEAYTYSFSDILSYGTAKEMAYQAVIRYSADENPHNDQSNVAKVKVELPPYPAPVGLDGRAEGTAVSLTWSAPESLVIKLPAADGVEAYETFATDNVGMWTMADVDGSLTYGINSGPGSILEYPNAGAAMAFQVFNPEQAGIDLQAGGTQSGWAPHSGKQMFAAFADQDGRNDDWLISPELPGEEQEISFYVKSATDKYGLETYQLMASAAGTAIADFKPVDVEAEGAEPGKAPAQWTKVTAVLPEGTRHFAIRCTSEDKFALLVDDITFISAYTAPTELKLKGYNVYRDDVKLNEAPLADTNYTETVVESKDYNYAVTAVYDLGESVYSNIITVKVVAVAIDGPQAQAGVKAQGKAKAIEVSNAAGTEVRVYTLGGKLVARVPGADRVVVPVAGGGYVVVAGGTTVKVMVD